MMSEIIAEALGRRPSAKAGNGVATPPVSNTAAGRGAAVASNAKLLLSSPLQVTLGNPAGDITLVEFFDYNCGFCKRALPDMLTLLKEDPKLKIVLKEFPLMQ